MNEYQQSLKIQRDNNATLRYAEKEARAKGFAEGLAEGLEKGKHKKAVEMALKLLTKGTALDEIADITGLTIKEIEEL
ncbi:hypothetical protein [Pedobacter heparinus]|uniref:hypothetical protein n=1 Tax=Pedobacter heparinus TaxID=984 RepID=UPI00292D86EA|nr:hypothetical protein [Pedobacter heparinus]